ncbi:hypothetical protein TSUD_227610 [Trifolium subterraneum]|uniref:Uncharacterized protein n=1 Tax=Trifolium subterraneum TaxID=3900 RepID=A0A2Z6MGQ2_TRISU|nr:hypothetical protein TSUD_227610 [Trifolium subterraneum]
MGWFGVVFKEDISNVSEYLAVALSTGCLGSLTTFSGWNQKMLELSVTGNWLFVVLGFLIGIQFGLSCLTTVSTFVAEFNKISPRLHKDKKNDEHLIWCTEQTYMMISSSVINIRVPSLSLSSSSSNKTFFKCRSSSSNNNSDDFKDALSGMMGDQVEELLSREENKVLMDRLEKASQRVENAKTELAFIQKQELALKQFKDYTQQLKTSITNRT